MKKLFIDSDVVISSLFSNKGSSYQLLNTTNNIYYISSISHDEIKKVVQRLKLDQEKLESLIKNRLTTFKIKLNIAEIKTKYGIYVNDQNDAHIIAGADISSASFLISYNIRHFNIEAIKRDFGIIVLTPGLLLQYLRSLS